ncbi:hypothetical protein Droror1_Dr00014136 [Drosera rotundifolia]
MLINFCGKAREIQRTSARALALLFRNQLIEALEAYNNALQEDPENTFVLYQLAQCLSYTDELEECVRICDIILRSRPNYIDAIQLWSASLMGVIYLSSGLYVIHFSFIVVQNVVI